MIEVALTVISSVIVDDLDILGAGARPAKADAPAAVDADAVLVSAAAPELLQTISWGYPQIAKVFRGIQYQQPAQSHPVGVVVEPPHPLPLPDALGVPIAERPQHDDSITADVMNGKRYAGPGVGQAIAVAFLDRCADRSAVGWNNVRRSGDDRRVIVRARPRRLRVVCWVSAVAVVAVCVAVGLLLSGRTSGGGTFQRGDQAAMIGLGLLLAAGILAFARPRVDADTAGIRVRNVVGSYDLPWQVVLRVRFDDGAPWAVLDLADDETVSLMAVQAADGERAVTAVQGLRRLLAEHHAVG